MAYLNVLALERAEAKIETTRGTDAVTMTHNMALLASGSSFSLEQTHELEPEMTQSFSPYNDLQLTQQRARLSVEFIATYEDLVWWDQHVVKSQAMPLAGTTTGSTPPGYTYTITPTSTADDIATSTWKVGDGAVAYKLTRCVVNTFTIRSNPGSEGTWRCTAELFGIFQGSTTFDSPALTTQTKLQSYGTKVYVDAIGGTIGTTQILARIRSVSVTYTLNIEEKSFIETGVQAHTDFGRGYYVVTFEIVMEHNDDVWFLGARNNTPYKIRIEKTGAQIGTTPTTNYLRQIDFNRAKLYIPTFQRAGQNKTAVFGGMVEKGSGVALIQHKTVTAAASVAA